MPSDNLKYKDIWADDYTNELLSGGKTTLI